MRGIGKRIVRTGFYVRYLVYFSLMKRRLTQFLGTSVKLSLLFTLIMSFVLVMLIGLLVFYRPTSLIELLQQFQPTPTQQPFTVSGIAVLGDSQSDEYRADDSRGSTYASTTLNWVEQLAKYRNFNFGEWGEWEEPRRTGFAYNYARSGATAHSMIASGQHIGVANQVKADKVNLVIIYIGANDFAPYITDTGYQAIYNGTITRPQLINKENLIVANLKTAIDTVKDAGNVKIVIITIPDWGNHIGVQVGFPFPDQRRLVTTAIEETNNQIEQLASSYMIPTINPNDFYKTITRDKTATGIKIGDQTFTRLVPSDEPHSLVLDDGVHPGTVMNGLFANYLIHALNKTIGTAITPFSNQEIFTHAGL